jgi:imidazolonepropionase-like amidohydrolase
MTGFLVYNGALIDGTGRPPVANVAVLIRGERIEAVDADRVREASADPGLERIETVDAERVREASADPGLERIDARGGTILPGFVDCHAHVTWEMASVEAQMRRPLSLNFYNSVRYLRATLDAGITTVRDAGGADLGTKVAVETGVVPGPRLQISISPLTPTGGHFDHRFPVGVSPKTPPYPGRPDGICDGADEVRKRTREVLLAGADVVKICTTGGVLSPTDRPEYTQFSPGEIAACVDEARYRGGRKVMAHAIGAEGIRNAIRAGVHSIEHGCLMDDEGLELMLERRTFLVPTLLAGIAVIEAGERTGALPAFTLQKAREITERHLEAIGSAFRAGVRIAFGTDAAVFPHGRNLRELELMTRAGLSPMEALVSATRTAAECLGWDDRIGTLEPGKLADLVICKGDPLRDIVALQDNANVVLVMKGGEIVKDLRAAP